MIVDCGLSFAVARCVLLVACCCLVFVDCSFSFCGVRCLLCVLVVVHVLFCRWLFVVCRWMFVVCGCCLVYCVVGCV